MDLSSMNVQNGSADCFRTSAIYTDYVHINGLSHVKGHWASGYTGDSRTSESTCGSTPSVSFKKGLSCQ